MNLLLNLWNTLWEQILLTGPKLSEICNSWAQDVWKEFPLGWIRTSVGPGRVWILDRSITFLSDMLNVIESLFTTLPAMVAANVVLSSFTVDKKLKQRVMTLDQVALFPIRVIIDLGVNAATTQISGERELRIAQRVVSAEKLITITDRNVFRRLSSFLFGTLWGRLVRLIVLAAKVAQAFTYVLILYRYTKTLQNIDSASELWFNAKLQDKNPRKKERVRIKRRVGGVPP